MAKLFYRTVVMVFSFLILWVSMIALFKWPPFILPSPIGVFKKFYEVYPLILQQSLVTMTEALWGFILGALLGLCFSIGVAQCRLLRHWFLPLLLVSQSLPVFVLAPLLVLWFGYGEMSKVITCMIMVFFPVTSAFYDGLRHTPQPYLELAKTMNASSRRLLWHIKVPMALPHLASGLRLAAVYAPMGAVVSEWVGASKGLGFLILNANARLQTDMVFAVVIMIMLLTLLFYAFVNRVVKYFLSRRLHT
jgi:putative hydroxymethylpyrimidine transport system permease protein